jgi:uncharacterized protein (DUF934 family)
MSGNLAEKISKIDTTVRALEIGRTKSHMTIDGKPLILTLSGTRIDTFVDLDDEAPLADRGDLIVPLARLGARPSLPARIGRTAVKLAPTDDPRALAPLLDRLAFVAVDFPAFADGRGYTHARTLRDELGYQGEIRATGDVGVDQLHYLARVGVTTFVLKDTHRVDDAIAALQRFSHFYVGTRALPRASLLGA